MKDIKNFLLNEKLNKPKFWDKKKNFFSILFFPFSLILFINFFKKNFY